MPQIDYIKALDIAAVTLGSSSHIEIQALDVNIMNAVLTFENGKQFNILMRIFDYELELTFDNIFPDKKDFDRWMSKFEFQLEQNFYKNISLEHHQNTREYKVIIHF